MILFKYIMNSASPHIINIICKIIDSFKCFPNIGTFKKELM